MTLLFLLTFGSLAALEQDAQEVEAPEGERARPPSVQTEPTEDTTPSIEEPDPDHAQPAAPKKPPEGLLPVVELTRLQFTPRDRPKALLHGTHLIVVANTGFVQGHDATTGEFQWKLGLPGASLHEPILFESSPLDGGVATSLTVLLSASSGHLIFVDGLTGEILQETRVPFELALTPVRGPEKTVFLATPSGDVAAYDVNEEKILFRTETAEMPSALAAAGSLLVVSGASRTLTAIDLPQGTIRWTFTGRAGFLAPAAFDREATRVYIGDDTGEFYCLDAGRGSVEFRWSTGAAIRSAVLVEGKRVYLASFANTLFAFNGETGDEHWRVDLPGRPATPPMRVRNRLMVAMYDGILMEVNPQRGRPGSRYVAPGEIVDPPSFFITRPTEEELAAESAAAAESEEAGSEPDDDAVDAGARLDPEIFGPEEMSATPSSNDDTTEGVTASADDLADVGALSEPSPPAWFERSRIAIALRSGEVLLLFPHAEPRGGPTGPGADDESENDPQRRPTESGRSVPF